VVTNQSKAARDKPLLTDIEKFDALMSISSLSKALAQDILIKKSGKGGKQSATKNTQRPCSK